MSDGERLLDFLKSPDTNARISVDNDKWLFWMTTNSITNEGEWAVHYRPSGKKTNRCLYSGHSLELALEALREGKIMQRTIEVDDNLLNDILANPNIYRDTTLMIDFKGKRQTSAFLVNVEYLLMQYRKLPFHMIILNPPPSFKKRFKNMFKFRKDRIIVGG